MSHRCRYVCSEKSDMPDAACEPVTGYGNPDSMDNQWLCKQPKPGADENKRPWFARLGLSR